MIETTGLLNGQRTTGDLPRILIVDDEEQSGAFCPLSSPAANTLCRMVTVAGEDVPH